MDDAELARARSRGAFERRIGEVHAHRTIAKAIQDGKQMTKLPRLAGLAGSLDKLRHGIEARADKLAQRIEATDARADATFAKATAHLDAVEGELTAAGEQFEELDKVLGGNGGPLER